MSSSLWAALAKSKYVDQIGLEVRSAFFDWQMICKQGESNVASFDQVF
jgi:hypothetical protein